MRAKAAHELFIITLLCNKLNKPPLEGLFLKGQMQIIHYTVDYCPVGQYKLYNGSIYNLYNSCYTSYIILPVLYVVWENAE